MLYINVIMLVVSGLILLYAVYKHKKEEEKFDEELCNCTWYFEGEEPPDRDLSKTGVIMGFTRIPLHDCKDTCEDEEDECYIDTKTRYVVYGDGKQDVVDSTMYDLVSYALIESEMHNRDVAKE